MSVPEESASSSSPDPFTENDFADEGSFPEDPFSNEDRPESRTGGLGDAASMQASMALGVARTWVREHQKTSMLGAFAVGVFTGAWLRE